MKFHFIIFKKTFLNQILAGEKTSTIRPYEAFKVSEVTLLNADARN